MHALTHILCRSVIAVAAVFAAMSLALAQHSHDMGSHIVHFSAMPSDALDPKVATRLGVTPAPGRGILNIAVARKVAGSGAKPVPASVTADIIDHNGNISMLKMREFQDAGAVYYVAEFAIRSNNTMEFRLTVRAQGAGPPYSMTFRKQFMSQ